jgi:hypothetical protein
MIITKTEPFTKEELEKLKEQFEVYIKIVIDVENKVCSAGMDMHFDGEQILLGQDSKQLNIWGGGIDLETGIIDCNSFINIRPNDHNTSNEIQNLGIREEYEKLVKYFFKVLYE